ncbi:DNA circularisation protein N-terminus [Mesorhizobium albiziae]|uniref:DNA circularisation protein N-terminus n=1 Tax=Neomesorhizobium albiziae TaxID=335020 RepID=A0A1I3YBW9_9HYPH|nr:DNA circularization N-terminal domain-containing protein [Mesorhizobium albiziae]GLS29960.1 hypothetical protein GCM10007937_16680 [Mesorhizobium albiziae]SFK29358.1 DNA circularisation protein N-terminus [Mesorhizobium albiziae]
MSRDWLAAFRPASFRGSSFKVDVEGAAGARRLSISPIAYSESSVIEDMGRDPRLFEITAYVAGDVADAQALALAAVLDRKGAGLLVLPMLKPLSARVSEWRLSRNRQLAGHVAFDIVFIEAGLGSVPSFQGGVGFIADIAAAGVGILSRAFGGN